MTDLAIKNRSSRLVSPSLHGANCGGFTLVEMLIALVLSSVIFVSAYQVMSNLIQYQVRAAKKQVMQQDQLLLRNLFSQIVGKSLHQSSLYFRIQKSPLFIGQSDRLQLISRAYSDHFDEPGYRVYSLYRQDKNLMVAYRKYDKEGIQDEPLVMATGLEIDQISFEYLGQGGWLEQWPDNKEFPQKIKVKLTPPNQRKFEWINSTGQF